MIRITSHFILYFCVIIIIIYLVFTAYIRVNMHFWHTQPVFHIYNLKYWIKPPGFINSEPPESNKFVNLINNKLITINSDGNTNNENNTKNNTNNKELKKICNFIKDYYVINKDARYSPSEEDILSYLHCSNHPSFFNIYQEPKIMFENGLPLEACQQEIIGVTSSRVLNVSLYSKNGKKRISFPSYYVDNLCIKPEYRKKDIPPQMIQTFYYNVSRTNKKVNAYMFKREGTMNAIVPLVYYDTYCFDITHFYPEYLLNASMNVIEIGVQQLNLLITFVKEQTKRFGFECVILPDVSSVMNLIKLNKLKFYGIIFNGELIATYIFRTLELYYSNKKTIECINIISNCATPDILIAGFTICIGKLNSGDVKSEILLIEDTAHSNEVIDYLNINPLVSCKFKSSTAFFLYNYACHPISNRKALLIY